MKTYTIKRLEWGDSVTHSSAFAGGELYFAAMIDGDWKWRTLRSDGWTKVDSLVAAKAACEAHWQARMREGLDEVMA